MIDIFYILYCFDLCMITPHRSYQKQWCCLMIIFQVFRNRIFSILNGLGLRLCLGVSLLLELLFIKCSMLSFLSYDDMPPSDSSSVPSVPPTTSIGSSSLSSLSDELWSCPRCCVTYSLRNASTSTVIPFALSFRACLSIAFAIFFLFFALLLN
jgi:hypothetical protein